MTKRQEGIAYHILLGVALFSFMLLSGCAHRQSGSTVPITPWEKVATENAVFSQLNATVQQGAFDLAASKVLNPKQVLPIVNLTEQVAIIHKQVTTIVDKGSAVNSADQATLKALIDQISSVGQNLINSGTIGVKNPRSQQLLTADIQAVLTLANAILLDVQAFKTAGGTQ